MNVKSWLKQLWDSLLNLFGAPKKRLHTSEQEMRARQVRDNKYYSDITENVDQLNATPEEKAKAKKILEESKISHEFYLKFRDQFLELKKEFPDITDSGLYNALAYLAAQQRVKMQVIEKLPDSYFKIMDPLVLEAALLNNDLDPRVKSEVDKIRKKYTQTKKVTDKVTGGLAAGYTKKTKKEMKN